MGHNTFGQRFVGARKPAWTRLGITVPEGVDWTVEQAAREGGLGYIYHSVPVQYTIPGTDMLATADKLLILREPTADDPEWVTMNVVDDGYRYLQNMDKAKMLDRLAEQTGWKFETVGALDRGRTTFYTLKTGKRSVFGDNWNLNVICSDGIGTDRAFQLSVSTTRIECENTLRMSDSNATFSVKIPHDVRILENAEWWFACIAKLQKAQDTMFEKLEKLAARKITDAQAKRIFDAAFPVRDKRPGHVALESMLSSDNLPAVGLEAQQERLADHQRRYETSIALAAERRKAAFVLYERINTGQEQGTSGLELPEGGRVVTPEMMATLNEIGNTPYAALNAVIELVDFGGTTSDTVSATSALFGMGAQIKDRAYAAASRIAASTK
jgi:hypothetical protein